MKKQKSLLRRIVTGAALCAMLTGVMLGQASTVKAEPVNKYNSTVTSVGVSGIKEPEIAYGIDDSWSGSYVYYGGHLFRVLAPDTTDFSADDGILPTKHTMLLDSDSVLGEVLGEHIHFDNDGNPNQGAERANEWEYSDLKAWLNDQNNGFLKQFSKAEIQGIASSTKPDPVDGDGKGFPNVRYAPLKDDHVFVLDAVEASREDYGYYPTTGDVEDDTDAYSRVKTSVDDSYDLFRRSGIWWLRSPIYNPKYPQYAGFVFGANSRTDHEDGGYFTTNNVNYSGPGPSPALNVDLDSVLLSTCVKSGNKYKLTLIYDGLETAITPGEKISINDSTVTVPFTVTDKDQNDGIEADCISVLVVRGDRTSGEITKYEQLTSPLIFNSDRTASGTVSFSLPSGYNSSSDHIYIFAENTHNSDSVTDYASAPLALMQPVAESGLVYDGSSHRLLNDDMRTIPSGFTAVYALSDGEPAEGSYSPEIPTARDAGVHRIWYKIKDNNTTVFGPLSMTVTIAKRRVGVSGITAAEKQYDRECNVTLSGGALNSSDIISGDDISIVSLEGRFKYADAGDNKPVTVTKITLGGTSKDNYAAYPVQNSLTGKVTQKPVKVTGITANNKEYDGKTTATIRTKTTAAGVIGDAQIDGIVANDDFSILNLTVSKKSGGEFQNAAAENNKKVNLDIKLGGYCSANYTVSADSQTTATANITARNITIQAKDQSVGVGGTIESSVDNVSIVAGSLVNDHSISAVTLTSSATDTLTDAGTITLGDIAIIDADGNIVTNNYNITKQNGVLSVTHEIVGKVTAAPAASAITYGQTLASSNLTGGTANVAGTFAWADNTIAPAVSDSNTTEYDVIFTPADTMHYQELTCKVKVTVTPKSITGATVALNKTQLEYNSSVQSVSVTGVAIDGLTLSENDYDVTGNTGTNVTNYTVTVTGKGNFQDTATAGWKITEAASTAAAVTAKNLTYDGTAQPLVTVDNSTLTGGTMYYALGANETTTPTDGWSTDIPGGTNAGTYHVWHKVQGDTNHKDTEPAYVQAGITPKSITGATVTLNQTQLGYTSSEQTVSVTGVTIDGLTLTENDYDVTGNTGTNAANYTVTVTGKGNYTGTASGQFTINQATLIITADSREKYYDGTPLTFNSYLTTDLAGNDRIASVTVTGSQTNAGTSDNVASAAKIVNENGVDVTNNYAITYANGTLTVKRKSITGATVTLDQTQLGYTSSEQTVAVTGVAIDGLTLTADDYTVTGNTGTNAANYTVTVTGKGNFQDTATAEWKITEAGMTLSAPDVSATYDGQPHGIAVTVSEPAGAVIKFKDEAGAYTLDASPTITNAGKLVVGYQITADNYTPVTGSATVTVWPKAATVTALEQTVKEGESIQTGTGFATLTDALSGHTLSAVTLTAENGKIVPSAAKIQDAKGNDVTGNYAVSYQPGALTTLGKISHTVTFKVVNGSWDDGSAETKTVTLTGFAGDTLKLAAADIPAVGAKPGDNFKAGAWDVTPSAEAEITADTTYTYTYADKDAISQTVTFKVVNGSWDDGTTADKVATLNGLEGETLKLAANQIPAVGAKPNGAFKAGSWDVTPDTETAITQDATYTYTYALRDAYLVTVTDDGHGTGSASPNSGYEGTEVTLTAYPAQGYKFKEWQVVSGGVTIKDNKFKLGTANVEVKAVFEAQATGWHKGEAKIKPGAPEIQCSNMQEVVESIIAAIQKGEMKGISEEVRQAVSQPGAQVLVLFISAPLSMDQIPAEDWTALQKLQEEAGYTGIVPFDITLMLNVNGQDVAEVHETKIPVKFSVGIMENLLDKTRQFALANVHNGAAKVLPTTRRGNYLDGASTEFSTYAIAYTDVVTPIDTPAPTSTPAPVIDPTKFDDVAVPSDSFTFKKVWEGDSEKSIDFTLYRQSGTVYHHGFDKKVVSDKEWQYDAWFSAPAACYVIEKPIPGYQTKYVNVGVYEHITDRCCDGGTIINKKIPKTGDSAPLALWAGMILLGTLGLTTALVIGKKRKANQ